VRNEKQPKTAPLRAVFGVVGSLTGHEWKTTQKFILIASAFLANSIQCQEVFATPIQTEPLPITRIRTGWSADSFAIETNKPILNPANCASPDSYMSVLTDPGYKTYYAAALMAFALGKPISVIISDTSCTFGRPRIFGIYLTP
jgi:hypothetical protein